MKTTIEIKEWISKNGTGKKVKYSELHNDSSSDEIVTLVDFDAEEFEKWFNSKEAKYIDIPEGIKFADYKDNCIGIIFSNEKQILSYMDSTYCFIVTPNFNYTQKLKCSLVECHFEDLKAGDIVIGLEYGKEINSYKSDLSTYKLFLSNNKVCCIQHNGIIVHPFTSDDYSHFYKVIIK